MGETGRTALAPFRNRVLTPAPCAYDGFPASSTSTILTISSAAVFASPAATARRGAYIGRNVVLMPSFVNIAYVVHHGRHLGHRRLVRVDRPQRAPSGAWVPAACWNLQANPTIIEDNCFIGARSEVVEGVIVEENWYYMGVFSQSTHLRSQHQRIFYGRAAGSVVPRVAGGRRQHTA